MPPVDIRDVRRKRAKAICGAHVPGNTYRRPGPCRRTALKGGRCWAHQHDNLKAHTVEHLKAIA